METQQTRAHTIATEPPRDRAKLLDVWRQSFVMPGHEDPIASALDELSRYFNISHEEARTRCLTWERDSVAEWEAGDRTTPQGLRDFYHTTQSWIFDTMWYHAQQCYQTHPAESVMIAQRLARVRPGVHLDLGSGPGSTSLFFARLGWQVELADISTTLLDFARWRFAQRGLDAAFYDLSAQDLPVDQYDLVTACDVMVHVSDPRTTLAQVYRALKPGGLFVFNIDAQPKSRETQWHLYTHAYPILRPVRSVGFQRVGRLEFFHIYRKGALRPPLRRLVVEAYDSARYNRLVSAVGDVKRAVVS